MQLDVKCPIVNVPSLLHIVGGTLTTNVLQILRKENGALTKRMKNILKNGSRGWKE